MAKLAARRQQEMDAAYVQRLMAEERSAAAASASASSAIGSFPVPPAERHKAEQVRITSDLAPTKPSVFLLCCYCCASLCFVAAVHPRATYKADTFNSFQTQLAI